MDFICPQKPNLIFQKCALNSNMEVSPEGVVSVSVHERVPWGPSYVTRSSQHVLLCSQTLHDLYDHIPCISKQLPPDNVATGDQSKCVICIEGKAFSYHSEEEDYAE
jgi:snRNA-activating protein complex subunit 3